MKVCFPVEENKEMNSVPYGHFGTAPMFIICDTETNEVKTVGNGDLGHEHGKCQPMKALSGEVIDVVIVGGIGKGAVTKLNLMNIEVYKAVEGTIGENIKSFKNNKLVKFNPGEMCSHHH